MRRRAAFLACIVSTGVAGSALAGGSPFAAGLSSLSPGAQCRAAIDRAERAYRLPAHLLVAIGRVESGRRGPDGRIDPWPYSINVAGTDTIFDTKSAAIIGVRGLQTRGAVSIDVGCMQVNLMYHPDAFGSLEEAFDPWRNADYAARFLVRLHEQTGSWEAATASYHSATPELGQPYAAKVRAARAAEAASPVEGRLPPGVTAGQSRFPTSSRTLRIGAVGAQPPPRLFTIVGAGGGNGVAMGRSLAEYRRNPIRIAPPVLPR